MKKDAYMTVESVFVVPTILISIMILIFMGIVMYQQAAFYSLAASSSSRASIVFTTCSKDLETGAVSYDDFKTRYPYRYLFDGQAQDKISVLNQYVADNVRQGEAYMGIDKTGSYASRKGVLFKKLYVKINMDYNNPIRALAKSFGIGDLFKVDIMVSSPVSEPVELIRNVDLAGDLLNTYASGAMEKLKGIKSKAEEIANLLSLD